MSQSPPYTAPHAPMLLEVVREHIRAKYYSRRTEESCTKWIRLLVVFHDEKHPRDMGAPEAGAFLPDLALTGKASPLTQPQALSALLFFCRDVLGMEISRIHGMARAKSFKLIPTALSVNEKSGRTSAALYAEGERRNFFREIANHATDNATLVRPAWDVGKICQ